MPLPTAIPRFATPQVALPGAGWSRTGGRSHELRLATSDAAEVRTRADAVARAIRVKLFLERPENRPLADHWPIDRPGQPAASRETLAAWVRGAEAAPADFDDPGWIWETKAGLLASGDGGIWRLGEKPVKVSDLEGYAWPSPDGASLAVRDDENVLWLLDAATGEAKRLGDNVSKVDWSADGKLAWSTRDEVIMLAGGKRVVAAGARPKFGELAWNPAGTKVAYVSQRSDESSNPDDWKYAVEIADAATGERTSITGPRTWFNAPDWSPDGTRLAYASFDGGVRHDGPATIETCDVATKQATVVPNPIEARASLWGRVLWLPGGGRLLFYQSEGMQGSAVIDLATGRAEMKPRIEWPYELMENGWAIVRDDDQGKILLANTATDDCVPIVESPTERLDVRSFVERKKD